MEKGADRWHVEEMGPRYARLTQGVVGFEARITVRHNRFKLGQQDRNDVRTEVKKQLRVRKAEELAAWVDHFERQDARDVAWRGQGNAAGDKPGESSSS